MDLELFSLAAFAEFDGNHFGAEVSVHHWGDHDGLSLEVMLRYE